MAETEAGIRQHEKLKEIYGKGYCYEKDVLYEQWDKLYGIPPISYSVYVLVDGSRAQIVIVHPYIEFYYQPFYLGHGEYEKRSKRSKTISIQQDKYCYKTARLNEIKARGGQPRDIIIGHFLTKNKAHLVERKLMRIIDWSFLTNGEFNYCEIPLTEEDCNVIYTPPSIIVPQLTC